MKRLRDIEAATPLQREAQRLIDSVDPVPGSPEHMARIRRRLDEPRGMMVAIRRLPALAVALLIGLFGASAFAAVRVFVEVQESRAEAALQQAQHARERTRADQDLKAVAFKETEVEVEEIAEPTPQAVPTPEAARSRGRAKSRAVTPASEHEAREAHEAHDSELVHRAVKALRVDQNPALAARLLEQDRVRNPNGPLAEEALSLRIEAALKLGDPRARTFAEQYIVRYPSGRYLGIARRARGEGTRR